MEGIKLSLQKLNIRLNLVFIFVLLLFSLKAISQTDSVFLAAQTQFQKNLEELNQLYCWTDADFYPGKFKFNPNVYFPDAFEKLQLTVFPVLSVGAEEFYRFLISLPDSEKQNLIRYFSFYENHFETNLKSAGLPFELKYIAPALSAMNPKSANSAGKAGVWQLTHFHAVLNGLQVTDLVDERLNVNRSTTAFALLMQQNYTVFGSAEMAILAWIYGNAKIKNALYFAGGNQLLDNVLKQLTETATHFIAMYQATAVFLNENRFKPAIDLLAVKMVPDTVKINRQMHFQQLQTVLHISEKQMEFLNPQYKFNIVPGTGKTLKLALPDGKWDDFVLWQDSVFNSYDSTLFQFTVQKIEYPPAPNRQYLGEPVKNLVIEGKTKIKYTLKTGDVLGVIAEKYDVLVADLKYWNNISNERRIQAGKKLDIFIDDDRLEDFIGLENEEKKEEVASKKIVQQFQQQTTLPVFTEINALPSVEHVVKSGESPFTIAKKYNGISPEEILRWNNIADARKIQVGQKLKIYIKK